MQKTKLSGLFVNLVVLFFALMVSLVLAEILFALFFPAELSTIRPDHYTLYGHIPGLEFELGPYDHLDGLELDVKINQFGFYDWYWTKEKKSDVRILIVGDSFVEGFTVSYDDHFSRKLESKIESDLGISTEVLAAGTSSWDTASEIKWLEQTGLQLNPDIVILQFFMNDVRSNYIRQIFSLENDVLIDNTPLDIALPKKVVMFTSSKSHLFKHVSSFLMTSDVGKRITNLLGGSNVKNVQKAECRFCQYYLENASENHVFGLEITGHLFERFNDLSESHGFVPVILFIPQKEQISDDLWDFFESHNDEYDLVRNYPQRSIKKLVPEGVTYINPYNEFLWKDKNNTFYYVHDGHTNDLGNELLSDIIFKNIEDELKEKGKIVTYPRVLQFGEIK